MKIIPYVGWVFSRIMVESNALWTVSFHIFPICSKCISKCNQKLNLPYACNLWIHFYESDFQFSMICSDWLLSYQDRVCRFLWNLLRIDTACWRHMVFVYYKIFRQPGLLFVHSSLDHFLSLWLAETVENFPKLALGLVSSLDSAYIRL